MRHAIYSLALATSLLALTVTAHAKERWSIATSSTGSGPYINGSAIAQKVNSAQKELVASAQTSGGYNDNLGLVAGGEVNSGLAVFSELGEAWRGDGKFAKLPNAKEKFASLRRMFPVTSATFQCVVLADSGIKSMQDLKGKKLNVNVPATATHAINQNFVEAFKMSFKDFQIFEIATSGSYEALSNGIVDATCNGQPMPSSSIMAVSASQAVNVIPVPDEVFERLNEKYHGTLLRVTIPAGTYPGVTKAVPTFAYTEMLFTRADMDEKAVYEFTKAYWEGKQPTSPAFQQITIKQAALKGDPPIHPGVERYLREIKLIN